MSDGKILSNLPESKGGKRGWILGIENEERVKVREVLAKGRASKMHKCDVTKRRKIQGKKGFFYILHLDCGHKIRRDASSTAAVVKRVHCEKCYQKKKKKEK